MIQNVGQCQKCGQGNPYTNLVCDGCGSRLPWADAIAPRRNDLSSASLSSHFTDEKHVDDDQIVEGEVIVPISNYESPSPKTPVDAWMLFKGSTSCCLAAGCFLPFTLLCLLFLWSLLTAR